MNKFIGLEYLKQGTERQKAAYLCLNSLNLFDRLNPYQPLLTGTIPLDVDIASSDLDIICTTQELSLFENFMRHEFGQMEDFKINQYKIKGNMSVVTAFKHAGFTLEIFCQSIPTYKQHAAIHMFVEDKLLHWADPLARSEIRRLKMKGLKTEPAFASLFHLAGDPYEALLKLNEVSDNEIKEIAIRWKPTKTSTDL